IKPSHDGMMNASDGEKLVVITKSFNTLITFCDTRIQLKWSVKAEYYNVMKYLSKVGSAVPKGHNIQQARLRGEAEEELGLWTGTRVYCGLKLS
ncbi:hypothetical protein BGX21_006479, partial [Mortierella sp. AD011]